jgi:sigma-B regulation protein RsbU (phosphoserine phosphatase)
VIDMAPSAMSTRPQTTSRVLVADDQPDILEALRWLLTGEGYEPEFVSSTDAVLERLHERSFDLLLMDLNYSRDTTSGREGLELIRKVRAVDASLPIVVMTGWGTVETAVEAMRQGARSFVQKPWEDVTLLEILQREIEEAQAIKRSDATRKREFEDARLIQRGLLPTTAPQLPGLQLASSWRPASGVGGDCFDMLPFATSAMGIYVADVAGKGVPAALLMSNLQAAVRAFAQEGAAPGSVCTSVNRLLCRNMASGRFVTFCYALIRNTGAIDTLSAGGTVLGVFVESTYEQGELPLAAGDRLIFYTDGITEGRNAAGEEFGDAGVSASASRHRALGADDMLAAMLRDIEAFNGGAYEDDATLIVAAL